MYYPDTCLEALNKNHGSLIQMAVWQWIRKNQLPNVRTVSAALTCLVRRRGWGTMEVDKVIK
jgi:hypothetical protein